ncbi:MAG TPA: hypothetical protein VK610_00345, partial [Rhodothermales bacterium]|nr:hypothetical protein [Rhodothermales bacterium]
MYAALTPADASPAPFSGPHTMRYRGFTLNIRPSTGGFRWAIHHDGLLLHADGGFHPTSAAAARAAR